MSNTRQHTDTNVTIRLDRDERMDLAEYAKREARSLSSLFRIAMNEYLTRRGQADLRLEERGGPGRPRKQ